MATVTKQFFRGPASLTETTLYSVPSSTSAVVTNIIITNTAADPATVTIELNGVPIILNGEVQGNDAIVWDIKQVLSELDILSASASAVTVNFHISGVEIS
jgi:hypothetical protein